MSERHDLAAGIEAVRGAVRSGVTDVPGDALGRLPPLVGQPVVSRDVGGVVALVTLELGDPVPLADLEAAYGAAARLPRRPAGGRATVQFPTTIPADGETGATVLAELDERGRVVRAIVRRDEL